MRRNRTHRISEASDKAVIRRRTDDRRGSAHSRGYDYKWQKYREIFILQNPVCIFCMIAPTKIIDHIIPVQQGEGQNTAQGDPLFWVPWNHQPVCAQHHRWKSDQHDTRLEINRRQILRQLRQDPENENARRNELLRLAEIWPQWIDLETGEILRLK
jgi:5-methylcytosine-specific restriction protein A